MEEISVEKTKKNLNAANIAQGNQGQREIERKRKIYEKNIMKIKIGVNGGPGLSTEH